MKKPSISIIIPAYNEEKNLAATLKEVLAACKDRFESYEILIVNDCSNDATGMIADELTKKYKTIKVIHNKRNGGLGYSYKKGVKRATKEYITFFPGDNSFPASSIEKLFNEIGKADIIIPYHTNLSIRPFSRQVISRLFTFFVNTLFGLRLRYYNGTAIQRSDIIKSLPIQTNSFAFQVEVLVKLLRSGVSYVEVGIPIQEKKQETSKAFSLKNVVGVAKALAKLFWDVNVASPLLGQKKK